MARRKAVKPSRAPRNEYQRARDNALAAVGYTKKDILLILDAVDAGISYSTVTATIDGRFRNDAVIKAFCSLTKTKAAEMFPAAEAPSRQRPAKRRNETARTRAQAQESSNG